MDEDYGEGRTFQEFREAGLLWLVNRVVFHPRGYALAFHQNDDGEITGWSLKGDGTEPWYYGSNSDEDKHFADVQFTLSQAKVENG